MVLPCDVDLLQPPCELEMRKHKLKRVVPCPDSYFLSVRSTVFSHSQTAVKCPRCGVALCSPTGGKARLAEGCAFMRKG